MRILFTNDDGYDSQGLHSVADLFKAEHEIAVVAPHTQKSGYSHSMTMREPIACKRIDGYGYPVLSVCGTPVDCVKIALMRVFPEPDVIVSGINSGRNLGSDIMYSGTVAAASEGAYYGIRSFALSLDCAKPDNEQYNKCAKFFFDNFDALRNGFSADTVININFPGSEFRGVKAARMGLSVAFDDCYSGDPESALDYRGKLRHIFMPSTDEEYCGNGFITLTPLTLDRTDRAMLRKLSKKEWKL